MLNLILITPSFAVINEKPKFSVHFLHFILHITFLSAVSKIRIDDRLFPLFHSTHFLFYELFDSWRSNAIRKQKQATDHLTITFFEYTLPNTSCRSTSSVLVKCNILHYFWIIDHKTFKFDFSIQHKNYYYYLSVTLTWKLNI
jgi:hypothetical protein